MNDVGIIYSIIFSFVEPAIAFAIIFALLDESIRKKSKAFLGVVAIHGAIILVLKNFQLDQLVVFASIVLLQLITLFLLIRRPWWVNFIVFFIMILLVAIAEQISVISLLFIMNLPIEQLKQEHLLDGVFFSMALKCLFILLLRTWKLKVFREEPNPSSQNSRKP
jgi:hypothetical protein